MREECLRHSVTPAAYEAALDKYPLLQWKTKDLVEFEDKKKAINDYFKNQVDLLEKKEGQLDKREAHLLAARTKRDKLDEELAQKRMLLETNTAYGRAI